MRRRVLRVPGGGDDPDLEETPPDEAHDAALAMALHRDRADLPAHEAPGDEPGEVADIDEDPEVPPDADEELDGEYQVGADSTAGVVDEDDAEDDDAIADPADDILAGEVEAAGAGGGDGQPGGPPLSNRVVWMAESDSPDVARSKRNLHFSVTTSPISLDADPVWRAFLDSTPRLVLTSGTLRVSGSWEFIRGRLGLGPAVPAIELDTPFNHVAQAKLVCLADFPSWAEHPARAMRTIAHQLTGWMNLAGTPHPDGGVAGGAMVLTTSRASAAGIAEAAAPRLAAAGMPVATAETLGNARAVDTFASTGGVLIGTRGLWQGIDISDPGRLRLVWINKLPFASFANPVIAARRAHALAAAVAARQGDPERVADESYYLPLAALSLRQAVGRLVRTTEHRGVVVISDNKLSGSDSRRRMYRRVFLGSLEAGLRVDVGGDVGAGNVKPMLEGWREIIAFAGDAGIINPAAVEAALSPAALTRFVDLPEMVAIRRLMYSPAEAAAALAADRDAFAVEVVDRCQAVAGVLAGAPVVLREEQREAIAAIARGDDLMPDKFVASQQPDLCLAFGGGLAYCLRREFGSGHNQAALVHSQCSAQLANDSSRYRMRPALGLDLGQDRCQSLQGEYGLGVHASVIGPPYMLHFEPELGEHTDHEQLEVRWIKGDNRMPQFLPYRRVMTLDGRADLKLLGHARMLFAVQAHELRPGKLHQP